MNGRKEAKVLHSEIWPLWPPQNNLECKSSLKARMTFLCHRYCGMTNSCSGERFTERSDVKDSLARQESRSKWTYSYTVSCVVCLHLQDSSETIAVWSSTCGLLRYRSQNYSAINDFVSRGVPLRSDNWHRKHYFCYVAFVQKYRSVSFSLFRGGTISNVLYAVSTISCRCAPCF